MNPAVQNQSPHAAFPFQSMLKESINRFLTEYRKGATDFSNFTSIFSRLLQNLPDPPLQILWFYSALTFHFSKNQSKQVKDLFHLLVSCSSSSNNAVKKIALLAPLIYELHSLILISRDTEEIENLLEIIISYISICCGANLDEMEEEFGGLDCCFVDSVRVWVVGRVGHCCKYGEELRVFFPLVNDGIREGMVNVGCLAGIVMIEAFLLRLCLKFRSGSLRAELEKELRRWMVQMIAGFRSYYFVDTLLRMLLGPVLLVTSILNSEDEVFLREILYDTVITAEFPFLGTQKGIYLSDGCLKNLAITWLFVADNAMRFLRENGDQTKVISFIQAFSASCLPSQLIKWVTTQPCIPSDTSAPKVSTPLALIEWLMILEDRGVKLFDSDTSKLYAKTIICKSRLECGHFVIKSNGESLVENHLCYCSNECKGEDKVHGDLEMVDSEGTMNLAAQVVLKASETNGTRKRKEGREDEEDKHVKFVKCHLNDNSTREKVLPLEDDMML